MAQQVPNVMQVLEIVDTLLQPGRRPVPVPVADEVLIRVAAAGINRPDVLQRRGHYPPPPGASDIPGLEVSGTIVALGPDVRRWRVGEAVCALLSGGGYAEYAVAPEGQCLPIPSGVALRDAAGLPETYATVWSCLFDRGYAAGGDTVLVHGGTSGIGTTAVQLGKAFGLHMLVTCGTQAKCAAARQLGADLAIHYRTEDFVQAVQSFTGGRGVDVVLDMVGGDYLARNISTLAVGGRHVSIAVQGGRRAEVDLLDLMQRRLTLTGATLRARSGAFKAALVASLELDVWPLFGEGLVQPVTDRVFALKDGAAAHAYLESGAHVGKILLDCCPGTE